MTIGSKQWVQQTLHKGFVALGKRQFETAAACAAEVLQKQPKVIQAHFLVGLIAMEIKDRKNAISAFVSVTKLDAHHSAAWAQLARLFMTDGQVARADAALERALESRSDDSMVDDPMINDPMVNDVVAAVYGLMGHHDAATRYHKAAMQQHPGHLPFQINYANSLVYHGRSDEAAQMLETALEKDPFSPQAHWILASARKAKDEKHIQAMRKALAMQKNNLRGRAFLHYAIGKEYEDLGDWPGAYAGFSEGAAARRQTVEFDEASEIDFFAALEELLTESWMEEGSSGHADTAPIFVLGQPRTGTTLVERIITSHSQVHSAGELQQFGFAIRRLSKYREPKRFSRRLLEHAVQLDSSELGALYMQTGKKLHGNTPRFVDKLPTNYVYLPLILKALPNAKIVHLVRNPMDACFSSFKQLFADAYLHSYDQQEMARHHARYQKLMDQWRVRFAGRFFDISYEATVRDLEPNARALIDYLELPWEDSCLRFHEQSTAVSTASAAQVREPAHTRSIGRWRYYEQQLQPMQDVLGEHGIDYSDT